MLIASTLSFARSASSAASSPHRGETAGAGPRSRVARPLPSASSRVELYGYLYSVPGPFPSVGGQYTGRPPHFTAFSQGALNHAYFPAGYSFASRVRCTHDAGRLHRRRFASGSGLLARQTETVRDRINTLIALRKTSPPGHQITRSFIAPQAALEHLIFVADYVSSVASIDVYEEGATQKMVGQINGYVPGGLAVDAQRNLYIADTSSVPILAPPYTGVPTLTLSDPGYYTGGVAVSSRGIVGLVNLPAGYPSCNLGTSNVAFYAKNTTTPCAVVAGDPTQFNQIQFDTSTARGIFTSLPSIKISTQSSARSRADVTQRPLNS